MLKGTPVVYFGSPWWEGLPGAFRIDGLRGLDDLVAKNVPEPRKILAFLESFVLKSAIPGFASDSLQTIVKRFGKVPEHYQSLEARNIAGLVALELNS